MKKLFCILSLFIMLFAVGCSSTDMGSTGTDSETKTESPADDSKYYDKDGKIILVPPENEEEKEKEEEAPKTEKADFSDASEGALLATEGITWEFDHPENGADYYFRNPSAKAAHPDLDVGVKPETVAGLMITSQIHNQMYPNIIMKISSVTDGTHSDIGHPTGYCADIWSDGFVPLDMFTKADILAKKGLVSVNPCSQNITRQEFKKKLNDCGIYVFDECENTATHTSGPHLHLNFGEYKGGGILFDIFDGLKNIGNVLSALINRFTDLAAKAYSKLMPYVVPLLWLLALLDIAITCLFGMFDSQSGTQNLFEVFIPKIMKYTGIYAVMVFWPSFINSALQTVNYINETVAPSQIETINQNVSQPQLLMQKGFDLIRPGIDFIAYISFDQFIASLLPCLLIMVSAIIAMGALMAIAIYITIVYIEFFVGAGLSIFLAPFSALKHTKFLGESASSWLINNGIRLITLSLMTGMVVEIAFKTTSNEAMRQGFSKLGNHFGDQSFFGRISNFIPFARMADTVASVAKRIFTSSNTMSIDEQLMATVAAYMSVCAVLICMCYLVYRCTESLSGALRGSLSIPD